MAAVTTVFTVRDSTADGQRKTGLTPTWVHLKKLSDNTNITPQPTITAIANGQYKFSYDAEEDGEAAGQIDAGNTLTADGDRYIDVLMTVPAPTAAEVQTQMESGGGTLAQILSAVTAIKTQTDKWASFTIAHLKRMRAALAGTGRRKADGTLELIDVDGTTLDTETAP